LARSRIEDVVREEDSSIFEDAEPELAGKERPKML
jgi:hypothetical protein